MSDTDLRFKHLKVVYDDISNIRKLSARFCSLIEYFEHSCTQSPVPDPLEMIGLINSCNCAIDYANDFLSSMGYERDHKSVELTSDGRILDSDGFCIGYNISKE